MLYLKIVAFRFLAGFILSGSPALPLVFFLLCRTYLRLTKTRQLQILNTTVLLALCCTFMQDAILTVTGHMNARTLPSTFAIWQDFLSAFANAGITHRTLEFPFRNRTVPFYAWCCPWHFISGVEYIPGFSLHGNSWFYLSCTDHSLSMATFCQWKHPPENASYLAAGTASLLYRSAHLSL